ncbi:type IV secretion system protein [Salmonella enterica]|nr:type IV secretion system protein VirB5 [Salmonella enterica subsp. enterica serovar Kiambu]EHF0053382.1 type IV secretion system protein VirB5 [Salmonella enterica]ELE4479429.1 type IV secretion system protein [Salmonella enterica]ELZ5129090.1 type IV secretion system protein [Salmonella enterica]
MKTRFHALMLLFAAGIPQAFATGIPVFDGAARIAETQQWLKEAQQWLQTAQHYKDQIQAYKNQLATATGVRDIASFVDQAKSLKADLKKLRKPGQALNDLLLSGGSSGQFDTLYEKYKIFDTCNTALSGNYANICRQQVINKAIQFEHTNEVQNLVSQTLGEINSLSNRVALARDSKESQDLANSIQLKSVMLNTLTTQWEMSVKAAEKREKVLEAERVKQWNQQQLTAPTVDLNS